MAKLKLRTGDIFQITLPKSMGFAYAKYIDLLEINPHYQYPSLVRVLNFRTTERTVGLTELQNQELLFSPLLVAGILTSIKEGQWKIIGNLPVADDEKKIPHYKLHEP
jgi:hypothetical protein